MNELSVYHCHLLEHSSNTSPLSSQLPTFINTAAWEVSKGKEGKLSSMKSKTQLKPHPHTNSQAYLIMYLFLFSLQLCKPPFPWCSLTSDPSLERQYLFLGFGQSFMEGGCTVRATGYRCNPFTFRTWQIKSNEDIISYLYLNVCCQKVEYIYIRMQKDLWFHKLAVGLHLTLTGEIDKTFIPVHFDTGRDPCTFKVHGVRTYQPLWMDLSQQNRVFLTEILLGNLYCWFCEILTHKLLQLSACVLCNVLLPRQEFDCIVGAYLQCK